MVRCLLGDMVSQSLQSSLSSPNFHYPKQTSNHCESRFFCDTFPENPALCIEPCFKLYHEAIKNQIYEEGLDCYKILIYV